MKIKRLFVLFGSMLTLSSCTGLLSAGSKARAANDGGSLLNDSKCVITFNSNGGILQGDSQIRVDKGSTYQSFKDKCPVVTREGCEYTPGWYYTVDEQKQVVTDETVFNKNQYILKADWKTYTVKIDIDGGYMETSKPLTLEDKTIIRLDDFPVVKKNNFNFVGWTSKTSGDNPIVFPYKLDDSLVEGNSITIKAKFTQKENVKIAINAEEGVFIDGKKTKFVSVPHGSNWQTVKKTGTIETPTFEGDTLFSKWMTNTTEVTDETVFDRSTLVKATHETAISFTFKTNGGTWSEGGSTDKTTKKIKLSTNPTFSTFKQDVGITTEPKKGTTELLGWYADEYANGAEYKDDTAIKSGNSREVYAYYKDVGTITYAGAASNLYTVEKVTGSQDTNKFIRNETIKYKITPIAGYSLSLTTQNIEYDNDHYTNVKCSVTTSGESYIVTITNCPGVSLTSGKPDLKINVGCTAKKYKLNTSIYNEDTSKYDSSLATITYRPTGSEFDFGATISEVKCNTTTAGQAYEIHKLEASGTNFTTITATKDARSYNSVLELGKTFTMPATDSNGITIKASVATKVFEIKFNTGFSDITINPQTINYGGKINTTGLTLSRTGYTFNGWYKDGNKFDFNTVITESTNPGTLTANWTDLPLSFTADNYNLQFSPNETSLTKTELHVYKGDNEITSSCSFKSSQEEAVKIESSGGKVYAVQTYQNPYGEYQKDWSDNYYGATITATYGYDGKQATISKDFSCGSYSIIDAQVVDGVARLSKKDGASSVGQICIPFKYSNDGTFIDSVFDNTKPFNNNCVTDLIRICNGFTDVPDNMFSGLTKADSIYLPKSLDTVGENAFLGFSKDVILDSTRQTIYIYIDKSTFVNKSDNPGHLFDGWSNGTYANARKTVRGPYESYVTRSTSVLFDTTKWKKGELYGNYIHFYCCPNM